MTLVAQKTLILAVETSGRNGSVAIAEAGTLLAETEFSKAMNHSIEIFPAINELLKCRNRKASEIDQIYISVGPGSFTGLRIAVTLAKIMHLANNAKIVGVDTLDVIARNATEKTCERIAVILDAKRGQFFIAVYERNKKKDLRSASYAIWEKTCPDSLLTASQFLEKFANSESPIYLLGEGLLYYKDKFKAPGIRFLDEPYWKPTAANVHLLGYKKALADKFADPLALTPNYLRTPIR